MFPNHRRNRLPGSFSHSRVQSQGLTRIALRKQMRAQHKVSRGSAATKKLGRRHFSGSYGSVAVGGGPGGRRRRRREARSIPFPTARPRPQRRRWRNIRHWVNNLKSPGHWHRTICQALTAGRRTGGRAHGPRAHARGGPLPSFGKSRASPLQRRKAASIVLRLRVVGS